MNRRQKIMLAALTALFFAAPPVDAQDVLLPNDSFDKTNLPNLGLTPATPPPEPAKAEPVPMMVPPKPAPVQTAAPSQTYPPVAPNQAPAGPFTLTVTVAPNTVWSGNDMRNISTQLGLSAPGIASQCRLSLGGMITTDHGTTSVDSQGYTSVKIGYEGNVTNTMLTIYALCNAAPNPAPYNYVQKMGNKYAVAVGSAFCPPRVPFSGTFRTIVITHTANGNDSCTYVH